MKIRLWIVALVALIFSSFAFAQDKKTPPRDPKTGRFVKTEVQEKKGAKTLPARDPKTGRFIKSTEKKAAPTRDPKTGRFVKGSSTTTTEKKGPVRDPKTGRFIKKDKKAGG